MDKVDKGLMLMAVIAILSLVFHVSMMHFTEEKTKEVPCYDSKHNIMENQVCKEEYYPSMQSKLYKGFMIGVPILLFSMLLYIGFSITRE